MQALIERDYFSDHEVLRDPYAFFNAIREQGPIYRPPGKDYFIVTGFAEALEVLRDHDAFSAIIGLQGASAPLPFTPHGSDITAQIEEHRKEFAGGDQVVNLDDEPHTKLRAFINTLFVPSRLKASEEFIEVYSKDMVGRAVADGGVDLISKIATPFVTMVVADLLGVPMEDRQLFMDAIARGPIPGALDGTDPMSGGEEHPFAVMGTYFYSYLADRRANPRDDILTEFAHAKYNDGTTPELYDLVQLGMFMFGAGQDTSAKLLGNSMKYLVEDQELQSRLRADPKLIPAFLEEVLRIEGSTKQTARLARKDTRIGDVDVPAGTKILVALSAANRDPRRWENPNELVIGRKKVAEHLGFGRGKHVCAGAPLARVEVRVIMEKFLEMTSKIELDLEQHPNGVADLTYEPSFIIRGLDKMHIKLTPAEGFIAPAKQEAVPEAKKNWSTSGSRIGDLLSDDAARAVLDKHFPGMTENPQISMAKGMTLRAIQAFAADQLSDEALDAVDADLARLGH
ncbi:cytochrome P450 [Novosphingobium malaysiense]|uniref:Cytochrome P450 n=1 Tax=Novosphingobium malaysiense TaxID=1348853 RepID=A0A0B1ZUC0_9SPHN|nr:cytochrome P450 [Novosphingobium malaysiense]